MQSKLEENLQLLPADELARRVAKVTSHMRDLGMDAMLAGDNANLYYLTGRVFCGYVFVAADGRVMYFLRRPSELKGDNIHLIRKPEDMAPHIAGAIGGAPTVGLMMDDTPYSLIARLQKMLGDSASIANGSQVMRLARAVKTKLEIEMMAASGVRQASVYRELPRVYEPGMTDLEFQFEIERELRRAGCLGQFRLSGPELEIFMGNVLTGENADNPSPYDFAMGGAGMDPSLPVGADGTLIKPGKPVMVDMNGNFTGYMTDMTRTYVAGEAPEIAVRANRLSADICRAISEAARPGVECKALYELAVRMVEEAGMADYFMGHSYHAGFVGHGIGITVNEMPVLAPRSRDVLEAGNTYACEPKFVIPGVGAVGVENTYVVEAEGPAHCITVLDENIIPLL